MVSLSTFDDASGRPVYRRLREHVKLADFQRIGPKDYNPCGMTPLLDATAEFVEDMLKLKAKGEVQVGLLLDESGSMAPNRDAVIGSVNEFVDGLRAVKKVDKKIGGKGFLVVATDGYENHSSRYSYEELRRLLKSCEDDGWVLIFLGAGIDAWGQGSQLGLSGTVSGQTVSTVNSPMGTQSAWKATTHDVQAYMSDSKRYARARAGSSVRSLTEDGAETTGSANPSPPQIVQPQTGTWSAADALSEVTEKLGGN
jgi:hypothetical protein